MCVEALCLCVHVNLQSMYFSANTLLRMISHYFPGYLPWIQTRHCGQSTARDSKFSRGSPTGWGKEKNEILQENIAHL